MSVYVCTRTCLHTYMYVWEGHTDGQDGLAVAMRCGGPRRAPASLATADGRTDGRTMYMYAYE